MKRTSIKFLFILTIFNLIQVSLLLPYPSSNIPYFRSKPALEETVIYLEKINSNKSNPDVISSIPSLSQIISQSSFHSSVGTFFSHQQKINPIEIQESPALSAIAGSTPQKIGSKTISTTTNKSIQIVSTTAIPQLPLSENFESGSNSVNQNDKIASEIKSNVNKEDMKLNIETNSTEIVGLRGNEKVYPPGLSNDDKWIEQTWGGSCIMKNWNECSHIETWGGDYFVKDKKNPGKLILKHHEISCFSGIEKGKFYCLTNGWTVSRCHLLCMSRCNNEYRQNFDKVVRHEGECEMREFPVG